MCIYIALYINIRFLFPSFIFIRCMPERIFSEIFEPRDHMNQNNGSPLLAARNLSIARKIGVKQLTIRIIEACVMVA